MASVVEKHEVENARELDAAARTLQEHLVTAQTALRSAQAQASVVKEITERDDGFPVRRYVTVVGIRRLAEEIREAAEGEWDAEHAMEDVGELVALVRVVTDELMDDGREEAS